MALGLVSVLALPAAAPVGAADPVVLRVGTVQDLDAMNPYLTEYYVGWEVFGLNYQGLVDFGLNAEPIGGFAKSWTQDGNTWTFKIDPDLKWSDGKPATSEDARWTLQTLLDIQKGDRGYVGVGYLDLYLTYAAVNSVSAPDPQTLVLTTDYPNTQILTSYLPILPKHIWEKRDINTDPNKVPVVGTGPYQAAEWKTGEYVRMVRNPNYQGPTPKAYQDEIFIQFFKDEGAMTEALKAGDIDYARNVTSDQFDSLKGQPNIVVAESTRRRRGERVHAPRLQHARKPIKDGGASTSARPGPGLPRCARLRHRQAGARGQGPRWPRRRRQHDHPAGDGGRAVAPRADQPADVRPRGREVRSSTPPATSSTRAASASTTRASRST